MYSVDRKAWHLRVLAAALLVFFAAGTLVAENTTETEAAESLPKGIRQLSTVEGITEYELVDNGLRILLFPDPSKQTATVNITYLVGSKHENYGETGMAHLLEHLVFKGSPRHEDIPAELTEHGARPNGTTWLDRTNYFESFASTDENLDWALDLEADRMVNSYIAKEDLDSEMTVVRNEFEMGENSPFRMLNQRVTAAAYEWHNYGKTTIGARADLENVPIDRLQAFYRRYYQPDNAILTVAGNFETPKTLRLIVEKFGSIPRPERTLPTLYTAEPAQDGERSVTLRRVGDLQLLMAAYHVPAGSHEDYPAVELLAHVLGNTPSGRLHKALVENGLASRVSGRGQQMAEPGLLNFMAQVRTEDSLEKAEEALLAELENMAENPPTEEEVDRARNASIQRWDRVMRNSEWAAINLSEWASRGDWRLMFVHRDRIQEVTPDDVARVAAAYLKPANRTLGRFIPSDTPQRVEVPPAPDVAALVQDYKGGEALSQGEAFDPAPAAIEERVVRAELSSGLKLVLVPKKTRGEVVQVAFNLQYGDLERLRNRSTAASLAGGMLMRGTEKHTREQMSDELDKLKASMFVYGRATGAGARLEVEAAGLEASMRLMAEALRQPTFPAEEFQLLKDERLATYENYMRDPMQKAFTAIARHMQDYEKDDPRYAESIEESIENVKAATLDEVKAFYKEFYGSSQGELSVVGAIDADAFQAMAEELFGDWQSPGDYERLPSPFHVVESEHLSIETPDKENAVTIAQQLMEISDEDPDYPALVLGNFMTGGGFLNSRLAVRLRQKDGLSYGANSSFSASSFEKNGRFMAFAIHAPQNAPKVKVAMEEEIRKITADGFTAEEIEAAKKGWLQARKVSRSQERELAGQLASFEHRERTLMWQEELEQKVAALTPEAINAAMAKYLDFDKMSMVQAGDFAGAAKKAAAEKAEGEKAEGEKAEGE